MHGTTRGAFGFALLCAWGIFWEAQAGKAWTDALRSWWVDPAIATMSFAAAIAIFDRKERDIGYTEHGRRSTWTMGPGFVATGSISMLFVASASYWGGVLLWVQVVPPPSKIPDGVPAGATDLLYLLLEVSSGVWAYDLIFSFIHLAAHHFGLEFHEYHHTKKMDMRARDVLTHSPVDAILQVLVNILVQRHTPWGQAKSRLARALHNVVVTWMLTESHTASPTPSIARRFFVGVRRHRAHHLGAPYYQQFFGYLDDFRIKALNGQEKAGEFKGHRGGEEPAE